MPDAGERTTDTDILPAVDTLLGHNAGTLGQVPRETLALLLAASGAVADRLAELDRATSYASVLRPTWAALAALAPAAIGQQAEVSPEDTGSHTDPQSSATVDNAGRYTAFGTGAGQWTWVDGGGLGSKLSISARLSEFSGPFANEVRGNIGAASQAAMSAAEAALATKADAEAVGAALAAKADAEAVGAALAAKADAEAVATDLQERQPLRALAAAYAAAHPSAALWRDRPTALAQLEAIERLTDELRVGLTVDGARSVVSGALERLYDFSGGARDGYMATVAARPTLGSAGELVFNGADQRLQFAEGVLRESLFTLDVIFALDRSSVTQTIVSMGYPSAAIGGWRLVYIASAGGLRFEYRTSAGTVSTGYTRIPTGVPVRATVVFESGVGARLYIDGALVATSSSPDPLLAAILSSRVAFIGVSTPLDDYAQIRVWRLLHWGRALSEEEIGSLGAIITPEAAVPVSAQPLDFRLNGVLDNSALPDWFPAAARPALRHEGMLVWDGAGVHLAGGRQLHHFLPRTTARFGFGFSIRPQADSSGTTWTLAELWGAGAVAGQPPQSARLRVLSAGGINILFEGYAGSVDLAGQGNIGWLAGEAVDFYVQSTGTHIHVWVRSYRALDGQKVEVWTCEAPEGWAVQRISLGGRGGSIGEANSVFERVQIAQPAYHRGGPDEFFGEKVTGEPMFCVHFDDGFTTDYQAMAYMESRGIRGTTFIIGEQANAGTGDNTGARRMTWTQIRDLHSRGFDIQCHTYTHPYLATLTEAQIRAEFEANDAAFAAQGLPRPRIHAYPYNSYNQQVRNICLEYRDMARSVTIGLDSYAPNHGALRTLRLDGGNGQEPFPGELYRPENVYHFIDQLCRNGGIGSILFHEIMDTQQWEFFEAVVDYAARRIKCVTFTDILKTLGPREMRGAYRE